LDTSLDARRAEVRAALSRGEPFEAFDLADHALADFPDDPVLCWVAALSLARAGATKQARARYDAFHLADLANTTADSALRIDIEALDARIAKDEAFAASGAERLRLTKDAAARYETIFRRTRNYYPGVNAATLSLLAGDPNRAEELAKEVLAACSATISHSDSEAYFVAVTEAEAALILGDPDSARASLAKAARAGNGDLAAFASTRRQLKMVCAARAIAPDVLAQLSTPTVIHYTGHLPGPRFPKPEETRVRHEIAEALERRKVGIGYGSLAAGADILFVEELLNRGAEANVTLPFNVEEFKQISVACGGDEWLARFDKCLAAAKTVTYATADEYLQDDSLFTYASTLAMGLALLRASFLDTEVGQIGVWDGAPTRSAAAVGTAADVEFWRSRGLWREIIDPHASDPGRKHHPVASSLRSSHRGGRIVRAMLFGDVKGFSKLREAQLPIFAREILGRFARVLDSYGRKILVRNTWGDGLYVVTADVETAANCSIDLQEEMATLVPEEHGLPRFMGLRLGGHLGPVFSVRDPVLKRWSYMGAHVSRTARIEPITPEGAVYVTEAFAAAIATDPSRGFVCEYVGQVPTAKEYGTMRMYSLRRLKQPQLRI
jgi:class 3 adenylate cyclase